MIEKDYVNDSFGGGADEDVQCLIGEVHNSPEGEIQFEVSKRV